MKQKILLLLVFFFSFSVLANEKASYPLKNTSVHYQLKTEIIPSLKIFKAETVIQFPPHTPRRLSFWLNKKLSLVVLSRDDKAYLINPGQNSDESEWGLELGSDNYQVKLAYSGLLDDAAPDGASLIGSSFWYPVFLNQLLTFELTATIPTSWKILNQGNLIEKSTQAHSSTYNFRQIYPQEEIDLIAGPYFEFSNAREDKEFRILLRSHEPDLAQSYLQLLPTYIQHYTELIGPYPYNSFSVVENTEETGLGLPSFTLLGSNVMRLPFILRSSLPHEILHNWWGNSVYVDYNSGNWSEGLTSYMADHWQQELKGTAHQYRQEALINYHDYVKTEKEFPLKEFRARNDQSSQAIGYSKSLMLFHMLKVRLGEEKFNKSIQNFYQNNIYKIASFDDIKNSFEKMSDLKLSRFFNQWVNDIGAPELSLSNVSMQTNEDGTYSASITIRQTQQKPIYELSIPIQWTDSTQHIYRHIVTLRSREARISYSGFIPFTQVAVDPHFDVFRKIYAEERPITLSQLYGARKTYVFISKNASISERLFFNEFKNNLPSSTIIQEISEEKIELPSDGPVVFIGDDSQFIHTMKELLKYQKFSIKENEMSIEQNSWPLSNIGALVSARSIQNPEQGVFWFHVGANISTDTFAQKLSHYGKYGVVIFNKNIIDQKLNWKTLSSPLIKEIKTDKESFNVNN